PGLRGSGRAGFAVRAQAQRWEVIRHSRADAAGYGGAAGGGADQVAAEFSHGGSGARRKKLAGAVKDRRLEAVPPPDSCTASQIWRPRPNLDAAILPDST